MSTQLLRRSRLVWASAALFVRMLANTHPQPETMLAGHGIEIAANRPVLAAPLTVAGDGAAIQVIVGDGNGWRFPAAAAACA